MKATATISALSAALLLGACSAYHPSSLSHSPWGPGAAVSRAATDPQLAQRYPRGADVSEARFPDGARTPPPRPASEAWEVAPVSGWKLTPLERKAEKRSIARRAPYAAVVPWGTAAGH